MWICTATIFAKTYGIGAVISQNLKGITPPVPPVQCWADKNLMSVCETPTLKRVGWREGGKIVSRNGILQPNACEN
jgi:hypothetical protein